MPNLRRSTIIVVVGVMAMFVNSLTWADELAVPLQLQVDLSIKVIEYVQSPAVRAADVLRIGIVVKANKPESLRVGNELKVAFDRVGAIVGKTHEQSIVKWTSPETLVAEARRRNLVILYFAPEFDEDIVALARAFQGMRILTIAAVDSFVRDGVLLGFELVSGHPKMVFNIAQAKRQEVVLRAAVMQLMRIVQ